MGGQFQIKGKPVLFSAEPRTFSNETNKFRFEIKSDTSVSKFPLELKDYWATKVFSLTIDTAFTLPDSNVNLSITYHSPPKLLGDTTFQLALPSVKTQNQEPLHAFLNRGKYVLVDYWGTWCVPCIEKLPLVKEIYNENQSKLFIIGIAFDFDIDKVKNFEEKNGINWNSYYVDRNKNARLMKRLNVSLYPTYRLYSPEGKLLIDGNSETELRKIKMLLSASK
ncbi:TlpA family protein disulfide reductase [Mucilaginibacter sp. P4]|nr:TlpA family protein disulfide reductase [Mucilaginibacter gossypii]